MPTLKIDNLTIKNNNKILVNFTEELIVNSSLALVGQSGSGKSLSLKTILNMVPSNLVTTFKYKSDFKLEKKNIGFIPQNPFTSLSPMTKIKKQFFCEDKKINKFLKMVELESNLKNRFPMELSGGQLQRIVIAIALSRSPKLLLLDEPTTALDENSKQSVLNIFKQLQEKLNFTMIYVTHDINSIENICENIAILKDGRICEYGKTKEVLNNPKDLYTKKLIMCNFENREYRV